MNRHTLLPAFPSLHHHGTVVYNDREHLLLVTTPRDRLTKIEQQRRHRHRFQPSFRLLEQTSNNDNEEENIHRFSSFFIGLYQRLFSDLNQRLHVDDVILDYNYQRLFKCIDIMNNQRRQYHFQTQPPLTYEEHLPLQDYPIALEFYLQFDVNLFDMKTCSYRGAQPFNHHGLFTSIEPQIRYGMSPCQRRSCHFCFPSSSIRSIRYGRPVVEFTSTQKHRFVSGYEVILNCPTSCLTKNIIYALTCPCGHYDYIGYTSMTLNQRLSYHRQHGHRILREFLFGKENMNRLDDQTKSYEDLIKDGMLLYRHSARCSHAMQWFLDSNPSFWSFVPILKSIAASDNLTYELPSSIPNDPSSPISDHPSQRSDDETGRCLLDLPPFPSDEYTFSMRQCAEQFQLFKNKNNCLLSNDQLDLYNATIIAVLPENSSIPLQRIIESLFITHAQTKLNTIGHLDGYTMRPNIDNLQGVNLSKIIADRGPWCENLIHPH